VNKYVLELDEGAEDGDEAGDQDAEDEDKPAAKT
jgi:hypothetical protein